MKHAMNVFIVILITLGSCSLEDSFTNDNGISGTVTNTSGIAMSGVAVKLVTPDKAFTTETDGTGSYTFGKLDMGLAVLTFVRDDYYEATKKISIGFEKHQTVDVVLRTFEDDYFLNITPTDLLLLEHNVVSAQLLVRTNAGFTVECVSDWLTCSPLQAEGSTYIQLTFEANETDSQKEATIKIIGRFGKSVTIEVKQNTAHGV